MKPSTCLLAGLLLVAIFSFAQSARREYQLRSLPPALAESHSMAAFDSRLDAESDPAELRRLALGRHQALLNADHATQSLLLSLRTSNRSELIQSLVITLLGFGIYWLDKRPANRQHLFVTGS